MQFHFDLLFPEAKHYSDIQVSSHDCLFCGSAPARVSPVSLSMFPPRPQAGCSLTEVREPEKVWCGGEGKCIASWPEYWTAERGREVATELTVLKIAKSKIPGTLVGVGCQSGRQWEG